MEEKELEIRLEGSHDQYVEWVVVDCSEGLSASIVVRCTEDLLTSILVLQGAPQEGNLILLCRAEEQQDHSRRIEYRLYALGSQIEGWGIGRLTGAAGVEFDGPMTITRHWRFSQYNGRISSTEWANYVLDPGMEGYIRTIECGWTYANHFDWLQKEAGTPCLYGVPTADELRMILVALDRLIKAKREAKSSRAALEAMRAQLIDVLTKGDTQDMAALVVEKGSVRRCALGAAALLHQSLEICCQALSAPLSPEELKTLIRV